MRCKNCGEEIVVEVVHAVGGEYCSLTDRVAVAEIEAQKCLTEEELLEMIHSEYDPLLKLPLTAKCLSSRLMPYIATKEMLEASVAMKIISYKDINFVDYRAAPLTLGFHEHIAVIGYRLTVKGILAAARKLAEHNPEIAKILEELTGATAPKEKEE